MRKKGGEKQEKKKKKKKKKNVFCFTRFSQRPSNGFRKRKETANRINQYIYRFDIFLKKRRETKPFLYRENRSKHNTKKKKKKKKTKEFFFYVALLAVFVCIAHKRHKTFNKNTEFTINSKEYESEKIPQHKETKIKQKKQREFNKPNIDETWKRIQRFARLMRHDTTLCGEYGLKYYKESSTRA